MVSVIGPSITIPLSKITMTTKNSKRNSITHTVIPVATLATKQYRIQVRGFDINGLVQDQKGNPDPLVDLVVKVKAGNIAIAREKAIAKVRSTLKKGWSKDDFATLGHFMTRKAIH